ncbi:MAG TPA: glycosyl hydrolase family 18 protein [Mycobacteriales bacterium]|nr:glycosyl hydrolase family 18 protein [Mycobacteriales bacterium]
MRWRRHPILVGSAVAAVVAAGLAVAAGPSAGAAPRARTGVIPAAATSGGVKFAYYDQWSIYQNAYNLRDVDRTGVAGKLDFLIYDFENIDPVNLSCFEAVKASDPDPAGENDPNAGDGAEDAFADYQKEFGATTSVDGTADVFNQPLAGNFHQLQELKAAHPNLKVLLSLGGWTYSKYFSDAAATASSRQKLVSSCVDMFIKGNIPASGGFGGPGTAAGIFDGFDIDWEYPGSTGGHLGNHVSPNDTANFTALLGEFRTELDAFGSANGRKMYLTAALPAGQDKISKIQTDQIGQILDFGNVMTYDMHGGFEPTGPTNFQDPIFDSPNDPMTPVPPGTAKYNADEAITAWTVGDPQYGIPGGFPASKLTMGFPLYYRGWTGVPAGANHGLYQPATGPTGGHPLSGNVPGIALYKEIQSIVTNPADTFFDPTTGAAWFYTGTDVWVGDSPQSVRAKADYLHCHGLGGAMVFSLLDSDPGATLFNDIVTAVNGSATSCTAPPPPTSSPTPSPSPSPTAAPSPTPTTPAPTTPAPTPTATTPAPPAGDLVSNGGFESGALAPWSCSNGSVVASPVHSGSHALSGAANNSDTAQCAQTIAVAPNHTYTLSAWVNGNFVFIGATGTGTTDPSTFTQGTGGAFAPLSISFTTGPSTTTVSVYVHGWFAQGTYQADDITVT